MYVEANIPKDTYINLYDADWGEFIQFSDKASLEYLQNQYGLVLKDFVVVFSAFSPDSIPRLWARNSNEKVRIMPKGFRITLGK